MKGRCFERVTVATIPMTFGIAYLLGRLGSMDKPNLASFRLEKWKQLNVLCFVGLESLLSRHGSEIQSST